VRCIAGAAMSLDKLPLMAPVRWWYSIEDLRHVHHLGWYGGPGQSERGTPAWFTADGLDPDRLVGSELFCSDAVEKLEAVVSIPGGVCEDQARLSAHLQRHGWEWSPQSPDPPVSSALVARTASGVVFWIGAAGLLVEFESFPNLLDAQTPQPSPRWPGFLLASPPTLRLYGKAAGWRQCIAVLTYVIDHMPWLADAARAAKRDAENEQVATSHRRSAEFQARLKEKRPRLRLRSAAGDAAKDVQAPPDGRGELVGGDQEDPQQEHDERDG